jgi:hypothetical protein
VSVPAQRRTTAISAGLIALGLALTGCASASDGDVARAAAVFEDPTAAAQTRCSLLAPATLTSMQQSEPCEVRIGHLPLRGGPLRSVQVWGGDAQVKLGGDTVFLTETGTGWKVTAALCRPRGEAPYDCAVDAP